MIARQNVLTNFSKAMSCLRKLKKLYFQSAHLIEISFVLHKDFSLYSILFFNKQDSLG